MSYTLDPAFSRGQVLGALWEHPIEKTDPKVTGSSQVLTTKQFTDVDPASGAVLTNEIVTCVAVRADADYTPGADATIEGYAGVVDEYLPEAGVKADEVFWLVVGGPVTKGKKYEPGDARVRLVPAAPTEAPIV
jgi:hypothetical protein